MLLGDHDVALASIEKVVAGKTVRHQTARRQSVRFVFIFCSSSVFSVSVGPSRTKLVAPNSCLKFTPEELVLYCRDLRVLCFLFDRLTPDAQAMEVCERLNAQYSCRLSDQSHDALLLGNKGILTLAYSWSVCRNKTEPSEGQRFPQMCW